MQVGELVNFGMTVLGDEEHKCPFKDDSEGGLEVTDESVEDDDLYNWAHLPPAQDNKADKLGGNLVEGKKGEADSGPCEPGAYLFEQAQEDSKRSGEKLKVKVPGFKADGKKTIEEAEFRYTVAAHHIIPGKASGLAKNAKKRSPLRDYMDQDSEVEGCTLKSHIGYDVNGSHNGVWLPGWYAIRDVNGLSWKDMTDQGYEDWQMGYVAAVCKKTFSQFHDSHENPYNESVRKVLQEIRKKLVHHQKHCPECKERGQGKIPPPFTLKIRLFAISQKIRGFITGHPNTWKNPWWTSERWSGIVFSGGKVTDKFLKLYEKSG